MLASSKDEFGSIQSGKSRFYWSRNNGGEIFGHVEYDSVFVRGSAGWWRTNCPVKAAQLAGLQNVQGPVCQRFY